MKSIAEDLSERLEALNNELIAFVEKCTQNDWHKICQPEDWPVGVTARHVGAGHYEVIALARMILNGEALPVMTMADVIARANRHAAEHARCAKAEVLEVLQTNGRNLVDFVAGLSDSELGASGYLPALGKELSIAEFLETAVLSGAAQHFDSMKRAVAAA